MGRLSALEVRVSALDYLTERVETLEVEVDFDNEDFHARLAEMEVECEKLASGSDNTKDLEEEKKASPKASPEELTASPQASPTKEITSLGTMVRQQLDAASSAPPSPPPALPCITPTTTTSEQLRDRIAKVENDMMHLKRRAELTHLEVTRLGDAVQQLSDAAGSTPPPPAAFTPPPPPALPCISPGCIFGKHLDGAANGFPDHCCLDCKNHNRKSYQGCHGPRCGKIRV